MREINVDDLQEEGEVVVHQDIEEDEMINAFVKDLRLGDRGTVKLAIVNRPELTMILTQHLIDQGKMKIFRLSKEDDPEYFL